MAFPFKTVKDIPSKVGRVLMRVDFNVTIKSGIVADGFRIRETIPTIQFLRDKGVKLVLVSHLGSDGTVSLRPVAEYLNQFLKTRMASSIEEANILIGDGNDCVLLENIRSFPGEKDNSWTLAKALSSLGEVFINDAFSASHRTHASVVGVTQFLPSYAGLLLEKEVANLSRAFLPEHPFILILGGKKAESKIPLIEKFVDSADSIIMGGALANDFLKEKGVEVGKSLVSPRPLIKNEWFNDPKFLIPEEVVVGDKAVKNLDELGKEEAIMDVALSFVEKAKSKMNHAKLIVWNGSFGVCENGFEQGTKNLAEAIIASGAFSIAGGGDTTAALDSFKLSDKFSFVSTGGGAMLQFLAKGTLPGIEALRC